MNIKTLLEIITSSHILCSMMFSYFYSQLNPEYNSWIILMVSVICGALWGINSVIRENK